MSEPQILLINNGLISADLASPWFARGTFASAMFHVECGALNAPVGTGKLQGRGRLPAAKDQAEITFTEWDVPLDRVMGNAVFTPPGPTFAINGATHASFAVVPLPDEFRFVYTSGGGGADNNTLKVLCSFLDRLYR